jgi:hypothetical protein
MWTIGKEKSELELKRKKGGLLTLHEITRRHIQVIGSFVFSAILYSLPHKPCPFLINGTWKEVGSFNVDQKTF